MHTWQPDLTKSLRRSLIRPVAVCSTWFSPTTARLSAKCASASISHARAVTKHLLRLEDANLIVTVWRGREKLHYLNPIPISEIFERWVGKYERHHVQALSDLKKKLEENKHG